MTDITKCYGHNCPHKDKCFRFTCSANSMWQSYADFYKEGEECEDWLPDSASVRGPSFSVCPFCNGTDTRVEYLDDVNNSYSVCCWDCGAKGPSAGNEEDAIKYWNDRSAT